MAKRKIKIRKNKLGAVLLVGIFGLLFFILVLRYSYIMLTGHSDGQDLIMRANETYLVKNKEQPERGKIYDRNGKILAEDVERFKVVAVVDKSAGENGDKPRYVKDKKKTAEQLAKVIDMKPSEIEKRLNQKRAFQVEFGQKGTNLTYQDKQKLEKMNLPGILLYPETERFYPNGNFASHLIGMAQKNPDSGDLNGALGVEKIFNSYLNGQKGSLSYIQDIWGYIAPHSKHEKAPKRGDDVHLTLDSNIQVFVEEALDDMVKKYEPKDLFAVVMDAKTGEILAYSQRPTFNPETGKDFGEKWANDLYQNTYEPGSTFKTYGLAAAIQEGKFKPTKKYESGHRDIMGSRISDWNKTGWGKIPMSLGFTYSSNTLMMELQDLVGADKMKSWYEKFGFGKSTEGMFDGEATGNIAWSNVLQQKTSAFGQSTTVTPVQMLQAQSAFFNKGNMLKPWFVQSIDNPISKKTFYKGEKKIAGKPITAETASKVETELDKVVNSKKSHATNYRVDGYDIEGKTGTAQVADQNGGGYVKGANPYFVSFIGDAPKKNPRVIVYAGMSLAQKNDEEAYQLGVSKAFKPIMENTLKYLNVGSHKDETKSAQYSKVPNVSGQSAQKAEDSIKSQNLQPVIIGNGDNIKSQSVKANTKLLPNSKIMLLTDGDITMPDMKGWTKDDVLTFQELTGINVTTKGNGFVTKQSVSNDATLKNNSKIEVELSPEDPDETSSSSSDNTSSSNNNDSKNADSNNKKDNSSSSDNNQKSSESDSN
ncbi:penicillin-binding transpeptidase domain-containing protein [Staphylococcus sp. NRL 16/872]|uniref:penicillin-binding protein n=1 Tax=Staphylococcus sp. NRL 16/872 TaxID=2930131 RepID=UPI001FB38AA6|nr:MULTISPECIES: penicillin-binding transpeptidase domain-containing protein [unclassified Staphylococcus]MCJ1656568.1 penicillin-binding protein [Staphylococcus sp. NRL 21/187]MCJ1662323.1 penicillin-binding protein [Staphylococcus sp. NRL 18/288]MCJ1668407.1 penicillin-binding protein [Staphylococcus sp. NRL 19/737]WEN68618.1 penicillin-binding transpeptidase domain-containing protein [Staphylococcus sp. NRL 16/872]